jgi:hypothetical protein
LRQKTGGRTAGTPNRSTAELKAFLGRVFEKVFTDPEFERKLITEIVEFRLEPQLLKVLLAYYAGAPAKQVEHSHKGRLTLEQIVTGNVPDDDELEVLAEPGVH